MPELPEVETVVRDLQKAILPHKSTIKDISIHWPPLIQGSSPEEFKRELSGHRIEQIIRRGKFILLHLDTGKWVAVHLRMTGQFILHSQMQTRDMHEHIGLTFRDGRELWFHDTRKFGRWRILQKHPDNELRLGLEPLSSKFTPHKLIAIAHQHDRKLKSLLLDQTLIAGLGNIYIDEALFAAHLHPLRRSNSISSLEANQLVQAIKMVLRQGIKNRGTSLGLGDGNFKSTNHKQGNNKCFLKIYQRTGHPCPHCQTPISRIIVAQRSTHICPQCQRLP